jgi:hypothetical protein
MRKKVSTYITENYAEKVDRRTIVSRIKNPNHPLQGVFDGIWWVLEGHDNIPRASTGDDTADKILAKIRK